MIYVKCLKLLNVRKVWHSYCYYKFVIDVLCNKKIVPLPFPLNGGDFFTVHGEPVQICDPRLMLYMKSDANPRNFYDTKRIAVELPEAEVTRVLELRARADAMAAIVNPLKLQRTTAAGKI